MKNDKLKLSKLERKLSKYEKKNPCRSDADIAKAICSVIDRERRKRFVKPDEELIAEAVDALLLLSGENKTALSEGAKTVRDRALSAADALQSAEDGKERERSRVRLKWIIPVAVAVSLLAGAAAVVAYRYVPPAKDYKKYMEEMAPFETAKVGELYTLEDGKEIIKGPRTNVNRTETLEELDDLMDTPGLLLPYELPEGFSVRIDNYANLKQCKSAELTISDGERLSSVYIETNGSWGVELEFQRIGKYDVYVMELDGVYRGEFIYRGNWYLVEAATEEALNAIINSLEERK